METLDRDCRYCFGLPEGPRWAIDSNWTFKGYCYFRKAGLVLDLVLALVNLSPPLLLPMTVRRAGVGIIRCEFYLVDSLLLGRYLHGGEARDEPLGTRAASGHFAGG